MTRKPPPKFGTTTRSVLSILDWINGYDVNNTNEVVGASGKLQEHTTHNVNRGRTFYYGLLNDILASLYKLSSPIQRIEDIAISYEGSLAYKGLLRQRALIKFLRNHPILWSARKHSIGNLVASAEFTEILSSVLTKFMSEMPEDLLDELTQEDMDEELEGEEGVQRSLFDQSEEGMDSVRRSEDDQDSNEKKAGTGTGIARTILDSELRKAIPELQRIIQKMDSVGVKMSDVSNMTTKEQLALLKSFKSEDLKSVAKMADKFLALARLPVEIPGSGRIIPMTLMADDDITTMCRQELFDLVAEPDLFYMRLSAGETLCTRGGIIYPNGPIIIMVDDSGSMGGPRSDQGRWSRAVFYSVATIAIKQRRQFLAAYFDYSVHEPVRFDTKRSMAWNLSGVQTFISTSHGGGTDFHTAIKWAVNNIDKGGYNKCDIIFVTDGQCDIHPSQRGLIRTNMDKKKTKLTLIGIGRGSLTKDICALADRQLCIEDIHRPTSDASIGDLLKQVQKV